MTDVRAHVDFEAFSKVNLLDVGTSRYAEDPSTEPLCCGWTLGERDSLVWVPAPALRAIEKAGQGRPHFHSETPDELFRHAERGGIVCAWNVEMEIPFWEDVMSDRWAWPIIPRDQWRDTGATALSLALPANLEMAGAAMGLSIVKDKRGKNLLNKLAKPRKPSKNNLRIRWEPSEVPKDYADLYEYCAQDVRAERAIEEAMPILDLPPAELEIWQMTTEMNLRGWTVDIESCHRMLDLMERYKVIALARLRELTGGAIQTGGQVAKMRDWLGDACDVHLPAMDKDLLAETLRDDDLPADAAELIRLRQVLSKSSTAKYVAMAARVCANGRVKNGIKYHGAATGRDTHHGVQFGNIPTEPVSDNDEGVEQAFEAMRSPDAMRTIEQLFGPVPFLAVNLIRPHFTASPGTLMYCADFSSIENRLAVWHADCQYGINIFNAGLDEYRTFGAEHYHVAYDEVTDAQRKHSKGAILLCVFGGGGPAMVNQARKHGSDMSQEKAKATVKFYRERYPEIPLMWKGLAKAAMSCVRTGDPQQYKRVGFRVERDFLYASLPSGRELAYREPLVEKKMTPWGVRKWTVTHMGQMTIEGRTVKKWVRRKVTPGRWFENIVQASARDAMMYAALATIRAGYLLDARVHDELVSEKKDGDLNEYTRIMSRPPPWLTGIRTDVTGWAGLRYRKD